MTTGRGPTTSDVSRLRSRQPLWSAPDIGGRRNRCGHRRGIPQDVPATESRDHHTKQKCHYEYSNRRDRHSPSSAYLDLLHHLVHRLVVFHESKRCIDCADAIDQGAPGKRVQILRDQYQVDHSRCLRSSSLWWKWSRDVGWNTVPPQAHLISIGSTKTMDDSIQFEGGGELPNPDSIGGRVASAIAEPMLPAR